MKIALSGADGLIGQAIRTAAARDGTEIIPLPKLRLGAVHDAEQPEASVRCWLEDRREEAQAYMDLLQGADVVVNAAGLAGPSSSDTHRLMTLNAVLPGVIAGLSAKVGVRRLVHISSAAVQGRKDPLDESPTVQPFSPYSRSKAEGERLVMGAAAELPEDVVIYRPTSVLACGRSLTKTLVSVAALPLVPLPGRGDSPLPVCLIANVAAGILFATQMPMRHPPIILQPWEGMTTRLLFETLGERTRFVRVPARGIRWVLGAARVVGRDSVQLEAKLRRIEVLTFGQSVDATALQSAGFQPVAGFEAYRQLAAHVRGAVKGRTSKLRTAGDQ